MSAFSVNVVISSAAHIPKETAEMLGSIPFGILLCTVAIYTGSVFIPFLIHFSFAVSTEYYSIYNNPEMELS